MSHNPTVFHITHPKSGSQWIRNILYESAPERMIEPEVKVAHFYNKPILPGFIYPTVYVPKPRFYQTLQPQIDLDPDSYNFTATDEPSIQNWYNFVVLKKETRSFFVIRDIRDTLISLYFSLKVSHAIISENVAQGHEKLNQMNFEDGFLSMLQARGKNYANIQRSWMSACEQGEVLLVRYEDLLADEQGSFAKIIKYCEIDVKPAKLRKIVQKNSFEKKAGRKKGVEDVKSHYRKGISGDWRNHFTNQIKDEIKKMFGFLLVETGYEKNLDW